jgi:DNA-binding SARP family transcriptional activator/ABC-type oligopeptide transport system substrate-binding subunit/outer membrane protein assembly factor BamB
VRLQFRILGPLQVLDGGEPLPLGGAKQRSTLAMLLLARNQVVSRDRLIDGLWGASPPPTAGATLDSYISRLRRLLPGAGDAARLVTEPPGYRLRLDAGELDLERFETLLERARTASASGDARTAASDLREALTLFRGTPLEDLVHAPFAQAEIGPLEELRLVALERRIEADLADGRDAELVGELEALTARNPFRETLWAELMLALYRSGRQVEALAAFDRARRILADEFGLEPGQALKQLQSQILRQDPSLEPGEAVHAAAAAATPTEEAARGPGAIADQPRSAPVGAPPLVQPAKPPAPDTDHVFTRSPRRTRWRAALAVTTALAAAFAAVVISLVGGGPEEARGEYRLGTVLIDLSTGEQIESIPLSRLPVSAYPVFADGHFWVNNWSPFEYVEIDARSGTILRSINPPARDPDVHEEGGSITPFVVEGGVMWVTSAYDLVKMDIGLGREVDRFKLDALGEGSGLAEGVAVGAGSVWVSRDVGQGQIVRLDPLSGRPEHVWNGVAPHLNLKFGDGALWAADERGLAHIDADTNLLRRVSGIQGNCGRGVGGCVAAGGGSGWTSHINKGEVFKVDEAGQIAATYPLGIGSGWMAFADGVLWVGNLDQGTVTGIDAVTGATTHTYRFDHPVGPVAAGDGVLLVSLFPGRTVSDRLDSLEGRVAKFFSHAGELGGDEPALNADPGAYQIEFATCAKLLNYPDKPPPEGLRLAPEIAAAMPTISPDRRTYTFRVRPGYRFSPPSNQPVTAETFRHSIERALSPRLARNPIGQIPPGPLAIDDIQGERAFRDGTAKHISGLRASRNTLSITLVRPSPDFLERLALPFFCPVPDRTPFVAGAARATKDGAGGRIPFNGPYSAGPYFIADYDSDAGYVVLKRNPNYRGPRPHSLDAIAIREGVDATAALDLVQRREWDGITSLPDPLLDPGRAVDQRWGARSPAARRGDRRYFTTPEARTRFIAFDTSRGIFADPEVRRAAALALDRTALATTWAELPTDQLLSAALPAFRDRRLYPLHASVAKARAIARGRTGRAVMAIPAHCDRCTEAAHLVLRDLSAIGIDVRIRAVANLDRALRHGARFDLLDGETELPYPDSASFLAQAIRDIPRGWVQPAVRTKVERVAKLSGADRHTAAAALADRLTARSVNVVAYGAHQTSQYIDPRIRCRVLTPTAYGLDLAALCLNG